MISEIISCVLQVTTACVSNYGPHTPIPTDRHMHSIMHGDALWGECAGKFLFFLQFPMAWRERQLPFFGM